MPLNVDQREYPPFWRNLSKLITGLMTQKATANVVIVMHQGMIKGVKYERTYLSVEELQKFTPV